eukprot:gene21401-25814_t
MLSPNVSIPFNSNDWKDLDPMNRTVATKARLIRQAVVRREEYWNRIFLSKLVQDSPTPVTFDAIVLGKVSASLQSDSQDEDDGTNNEDIANDEGKEDDVVVKRSPEGTSVTKSVRKRPRSSHSPTAFEKMNIEEGLYVASIPAIGSARKITLYAPRSRFGELAAGSAIRATLHRSRQPNSFKVLLPESLSEEDLPDAIRRNLL